MKVLFAVVALAVLAVAVVRADEALEGVTDLTSANFDSTISGNDNVLVMFYAPWCGHCKRLKPTYSEAGVELKSSGSTGILAKVDCTVEKELCGKYGVRGYPTLKAFRGDTDPDKAEKYTMGRTKEDLISFMTKSGAAASTVSVIDTASKFTNTISGDKLALVLFADAEDKSRKLHDLLTKAASQQEGELASFARVDCTRNKELCSQHAGPKLPALKAYADGEFIASFRKRRTVSELLNFIDDLASGGADSAFEDGVLVLTADTWDKLLSKKHPETLVMFYAPWCGHCKALKPTFSKVAGQLSGQTLAKIDCTQNQALCSSHGVSGYPTVKYFKRGKHVADYSGDRSEADLLRFMAARKSNSGAAVAVSEDQQHARTAAAVVKPEDVAVDETPGDVVELTDANFDAFVAKHPRVLVKFFAPWCGHCKKFRPFYDKAAVEMKKRGHKGVIAVLDCTTDEATCSKFDVTSYPTVKLFVDGKFKEDYRRPRTTENVISYVAQVPLVHTEEDEAQAKPAPKKKHETADEWNVEAKDVVQLTPDNFDKYMADNKDKKILVKFYAPWCGFCKRLKPIYSELATEFKEKHGDKYVFANVNCVGDHASLCSEAQYNIRLLPTLKLFVDGKYKEDYEGDRSKEDIRGYMDGVSPRPKPKEDPPPKKNDKGIEEEVFTWDDSDVKTLKDKGDGKLSETFDDAIKASKRALVMFYAPWCGYGS